MKTLRIVLACLFLVMLFSLNALASTQEVYGVFSDEFLTTDLTQGRRVIVTLYYVLVAVLPCLGGVAFSLVKMLRKKEKRGLWAVLLLLIALYLSFFTIFFVLIF